MARGDFSEAIARLGTDPSRWLVGFDFDGTLSPIVPRAEDARLEPGLLPLLLRLRDEVGTVAVISGRPREYLAAALPSGLLLVGSYGIELPADLFPRGAPRQFDVTGARARLETARPMLEEQLPPGARLEVKPFGLVLHYRGAGAEFDEEAARDLVGRVAASCDLEVAPGRLVMELKPHGVVDKGWALGMLGARLDAAAVVFIGDDLGDVPAWEAVRQMAQRVPALGVGIASTELPGDALEACDVVLSDRALLPSFIEALIDQAAEVRGRA